jgi:hypothetical protein
MNAFVRMALESNVTATGYHQDTNVVGNLSMRRASVLPKAAPRPNQETA